MNFAISTLGVSQATAAGGSTAALAHRELSDAAQQFEGMLLQEMLKPMKEHGFCQDESEGDSDGKDALGSFGDTLSGFGTEALATAIAKGGGLGIAKRVVDHVEGEQKAHRAAATHSIKIPK